jgi:cytochrome c oxidase subunit II
MTERNLGANRKIIIASASPLFARGLEKMLRMQEAKREIEIRHASTTAQIIQRLEKWQPDVVIVDYDDQTIDRTEFLSYFVEGERTMQVMLVSLKSNGSVVVYDRRKLTADQAEDWLGLFRYNEI